MEPEQHLASTTRGGLRSRIPAGVWDLSRPMPPPPPGSKVLHFVRHGQGVHNVAVAQSAHGCPCERQSTMAGYTCPMADPALVDARLTEKGRAQASQLRHQIKAAQVQLVVASPLTRCLETATLATELLPAAVPRMVVEACRERLGTHVCNVRRPVSALQADFPAFDFGSVLSDADDMANLYEPGQREPADELAKRGVALLEFLFARPEAVICVVSHSSFLACLFHSLFEFEGAGGAPQYLRTGELFSVVVSSALPRP